MTSCDGWMKDKVLLDWDLLSEYNICGGNVAGIMFT